MLKVMTLNIQAYADRYGPWETRRPLIESEIELAGPDLVALQAVRQDPALYGGLNQARQLAGRFPEYPFVVYQAATSDDDGASTGIAILSRLPFADTGRLELTHLPGLEDTDQRAVLMARFDLPGGPFWLFNTHFSWVPEQTIRNVNETLAYLESFSGPAMLAGDLNVTPNSPAMQALREYGWTDVWEALHPDEAGFTFVEGERLAKRIDYAWVNPQLLSRINSIKIIANQEQVSGVRPSDHAGLLIELDLELASGASQEIYP